MRLSYGQVVQEKQATLHLHNGVTAAQEVVTGFSNGETCLSVRRAFELFEVLEGSKVQFAGDSRGQVCLGCRLCGILRSHRVLASVLLRPPDGRRTNGRQQDTCSPFSPALFDFVRRSCFSLPPLSLSLVACRPGFQGDDDCVLYRDADGRRHRDGLPVFRAVNKGRRHSPGRAWPTLQRHHDFIVSAPLHTNIIVCELLHNSEEIRLLTAALYLYLTLEFEKKTSNALE